MGADEKRILVVEDEDAVRALLFTVLRRRGFSVDTARNGVEALERCARCNYRVLLLDMMMPLMSGWEFLDEISKVPVSERPVVIVLTAGTMPRNLDPEVVSGTIRKPFDIELLVDTVTACLNSCRTRQQLDDCPNPESDAEDGELGLDRRGEPN